MLVSGLYVSVSNMVATVKLYAQLDNLEYELRERIIPHLEGAAAGNNDLAFNATDFTSSRNLKLQIDPEIDTLIHLGRQILVLREKLNEPTINTIAERICWYCRKRATIGNSQKKVVQELAQKFLDEILASSISRHE
jgi:hypothetical protein